LSNGKHNGPTSAEVEPLLKRLITRLTVGFYPNQMSQHAVIRVRSRRRAALGYGFAKKKFGGKALTAAGER
jgi:hypothetical protein